MVHLREIFEENRGPPANVEAIIRLLGIDLDKNARLDSEISGQIERCPDGSYRISVNADDPYFRKRFTMAHELGHYLYHSHLMEDGIDDTRAYRSTQAGRFHNARIGRHEESEANRFAAGLLMPSDLVRESWAELRDPGMMAKRFQVSTKAMEIRLRGLGLMD